MSAPKKRAGEIIAETFGFDVAEIADYRYQPTRFPIPVYAIGDVYVCCPPARMLVGALPSGFVWKQNADQAFAKRAGRVVYVAIEDRE